MNKFKHSDLSQFLMDIYDEENCFKYSGRGMMGNECLAIRTDNVHSEISEIVTLAIDECFIHSDDVEELKEKVKYLVDVLCECRVDSLGLDYVIYWPDLPFINFED